MEIIRDLLDLAADSWTSSLVRPAQTFKGRVAFLWATRSRIGSPLGVAGLLVLVVATSRLRRGLVAGASGSEL